MFKPNTSELIENEIIEFALKQLGKPYNHCYRGPDTFEVDEISKEIEEKNDIIKQLEEHIKALTKDNKQKDNDFNELETQLKDTKQELDTLKKVEKEKIEEIKKSNQEAEKDRNRLIRDDYDRKLESFRKMIEDISEEKYPLLYEKTKSLYETLFTLIKKFSSTSYYDTELDIFRNIYPKLLIPVLCYMTGANPREIQSIRELIKNGIKDKGSFTTKYGINADYLNYLCEFESVCNNGKHGTYKDTVKKANENKHQRDTKIFDEFKRKRNEDKKKIVLSTVELIMHGNFKEKDYKEINDLIEKEMKEVFK